MDPRDEIKDVLTRMFDYVVIDSTMSVDPIYSLTLNHATLTLVVTQLNVPSAKNAERFVGALRRSEPVNTASKRIPRSAQ